MFFLFSINNKGDPYPLNKTNIVLISKNQNLTLPSHFSLISLCNIVFKLVTKTIANRLKLILPDIIDKSQSVFVLGRLITDDALIAFDAFHYMENRDSSHKGHMALKLDMIMLNGLSLKLLWINRVLSSNGLIWL